MPYSWFFQPAAPFTPRALNRPRHALGARAYNKHANQGYKNSETTRIKGILARGQYLQKLSEETKKLPTCVHRSRTWKPTVVIMVTCTHPSVLRVIRRSDVFLYMSIFTLLPCWLPLLTPPYIALALRLFLRAVCCIRRMWTPKSVWFRQLLSLKHHEK